MNWIDIALFIAVLIGVAAGGFLVARSPAFWVGMAVEVFRRLLPTLMKRMPPEKEAEWRAAQRSGRGDEWLRRRKR